MKGTIGSMATIMPASIVTLVCMNQAESRFIAQVVLFNVPIKYGLPVSPDRSIEPNFTQS